MQKNKIKLLCTLGPSTLNEKFLKFAKGKIDLIRLNMSHVDIRRLPKIIKYIKKITKIPICIDTEGAQIRTKLAKKIFYKKNQTFKIYSYGKGNFSLYPDIVFEKVKRDDILLIGFDNLKAKVLKVNKKFILLKTIFSGVAENNKGVHIANRRIYLQCLTSKDIQAIKIGKRMKVKHYALSFTNNINDMAEFKKILKKENKIFKIETLKALKNIKSILKEGQEFIIDRGDLSKEVKIENIPYYQRKILHISKKYSNKKVYIATNLLESMINTEYPTRGEANDIYSSLEMGAAGLVLAAETAVGKYPIQATAFVKKMIRSFLNKNAI